MRFSFLTRFALRTLFAVQALGFVSVSMAQSRPDPIMGKDELRACMLRKDSQEKEAAVIKKSQADFTAEYDALKVEQSEVVTMGEGLRTRASGLNAERTAISAKTVELQTMAANAKTDADRAAYEVERTKLLERGQVLDRAAQAFNADQAAHAKRVETLNAKIADINHRRNTVNDRVEPLRKEIAAWRESCSNRRYREEDEIALKRELAAQK